MDKAVYLSMWFIVFILHLFYMENGGHPPLYFIVMTGISGACLLGMILEIVDEKSIGG